MFVCRHRPIGSHRPSSLRHMQCLSAFGMVVICCAVGEPKALRLLRIVRTVWISPLRRADWTALVFGTCFDIFWWWNSMLRGSGVTWIWKRSLWTFHWWKCLPAHVMWLILEWQIITKDCADSDCQSSTLRSQCCLLTLLHGWKAQSPSKSWFILLVCPSFVAFSVYR